MKRKVCLIGEQGVGKTSLVRRFVTGQFDEAYVRTLGAMASKKTVLLEEGLRDAVRVDLIVLDIMGKRTFLDLFRDAYFAGAAGALAVFDLTRPDTLSDLVAWIESMRKAVGPIPALALGNKSDLRDRIGVGDDEMREALDPLSVPYRRTSAKSGENVESAFRDLAERIAGRSPPKSGEK